MQSSLRKSIFFVVLVGMTYVAYSYMIKPANKYLAEEEVRVQIKSDKLAKLEEVTKTAKDLTKQLEQLQEAVQFFESKIPPKSEVHKVLKQVTLIAQKQGLESKTIQTLKTKNNSGYMEQPLKMQLRGDFDSFYSFLLEMEQLPRIMKIRELKLVKQANQDGQIAVDFIVSIFFQNKTS